MTDPFAPQNQGAFLSFLDYLDKPGQVVRNLLRGNPGAAGRQALDILGDTVDSVLPGDWIGNASGAEDYVSGGELVGLKEPGIGKTLADIGVGIVTDPLSFIPGKAAMSAARTVGKVATQGLEKAVGKEAVAAGGRNLRATFGASRVSPKMQAILDASRAAKANETQAGMGAIKSSVLGTLSPDEANIVSDALDNFKWEGNNVTGRLGNESLDPIKLLEQHPGVNPENLGRMRDAVAEAMHIGQQQAKREGVFFKRSKPDPTVFGASTEPQTGFKGDYLQRVYKGQTENQALDELLGRDARQMGSPSAVKDRELLTPEQVQGFLSENPKVSFERNAVTRLGKRAEQQGALAQRAEIGKAILGEGYTHADEGMRSQVVQHFEEMAKSDPESAKVMLDAFRGIAPRGKIMETLAKANRIFKPAAVYGLLIPKFGSIVRNKIGGVWQSFSNPASRGVAVKQLGRMDSDIVGSLADTFGWTYPRDKMASVLHSIDDAMGASGGLTDNAIQALEQTGKKDAADLIRSGVLDGFVRSEDLAKEMARSPMGKKVANIIDWPGRIFRGVEDRMRAGMYLDLVGKGKKGHEAAQIVRDSLYDYSTNSIQNRRARDFIPFFQFSAKAIPQQAKLLAEKPMVATALASAMGSDPNEPIYPYMEGKTNFAIGADEQGNQQYLSGLGLPFEALNMIPNPSDDIGAFGRQVEQSVVGSSQPLLKTAFSATAGEDPYFGAQYGSYSKIPAVGESGDLGRYYNMAAGSGLIQPIDSPLRVLDKIMDPRRGAGTKAIDVLTGANVVNVDPDRALQQQVTRAVETNPDIQKYTGFYSESDNPDTLELLKRYQEVKAANKAKREAQKAKGDIL